MQGRGAGRLQPPRSESRGEGPPRKPGAQGALLPLWPGLSVSGLVGWRPRSSSPASAPGLLCPGSGRKPSAPPPKGYFPTAAWEEAPEPGGKRGAERSADASPVTRGGETPGPNRQRVPPVAAPGVSLRHTRQRRHGCSRGPARLRKPPGRAFPSGPSLQEHPAQQALPYLVPWGSQQDKSVFPLEEGTKVLALLIAAQLHCLHTLLLVLWGDRGDMKW